MYMHVPARVLYCAGPGGWEFLHAFYKHSGPTCKMQSLLSCCFRLALCLAICRAAHRPEPEPPYGAADPPTPPPAEILALKPSSGPTTGGTVITLFGTHLEPLQSTLSPICRFGESGLSSDGKFSGKASYGIVTCTVPAAYAGYEVAVELSLDGGSVYTTAGHRFRFYHEAFVESASPSSGPAAGGTLVRVTGYTRAYTRPAMRVWMATGAGNHDRLRAPALLLAATHGQRLDESVL